MSRDPAAETEALRTAIREAHETLKDMRAERRAMEQLLSGIEGRVAQRMEDAVAHQVAELGKATGRAMRASVAKVEREFDRLERIFTGREYNDQPPLEDVLRRHVAARRERAEHR